MGYQWMYQPEYTVTREVAQHCLNCDFPVIACLLRSFDLK